MTNFLYNYFNCYKFLFKVYMIMNIYIDLENKEKIRTTGNDNKKEESFKIEK